MDINFSDQVAIITGGGRGIGKCYAEYLAARGAKVIINSKSDTCKQVATALVQSGGQAVSLQGDIGDPEVCKTIIQQTISTFGRIDILINNAGNRLPGTGSLSDLDNNDLNTIMRVHVNGTFNLSIAAWKYMAQQGYGRILNTSSGLAFGGGFSSGYILNATAKSAIIGLTKSLALQGQSDNILVNAIMPISSDDVGSHLTSLTEPQIQSLAKLAPAETIPPTVAFLIHSTAPCSGEIFSVCNGRIARVFLGECGGYRADNVQSDDPREYFSQVMDTHEFSIPGDFMDDVALGYGDLFATLQEVLSP
jgi:NAD(P)-dependent dehydrogenase (short-subunit alcohol dehydrogenase family)